MWELRVCVGGSGGLLARRSDREWISEGRIFLRRQEGWRLGWVSSGSSSDTEDYLEQVMFRTSNQKAAGGLALVAEAVVKQQRMW